jgi:hypothetical protein
MFDAQMVQHAGDDHIYKVIEGPRAVIEGGRSWHDSRACPVSSKHVVDVDF